MTRIQHKVIWWLVKAEVAKRDWYKCAHCGKVVKGLNLSHLYPEGQYPRLKYDHNNTILLCSRCHLYWWHKNIIEAYQWFKSYVPLKTQKYLKYRIANYKKLEKPDFNKLMKKYAPKVWKT